MAAEVKAETTASDFNFLGLDNLGTGKTTIQMTNAGPQPHELTILKLENGYTADQLKADIASETGPAGPPITDAGGIGALTKGLKGYVTVDLAAGDYALVCFVPDATTGAPHAALGMVKGITVKSWWKDYLLRLRDRNPAAGHEPTRLQSMHLWRFGWSYRHWRDSFYPQGVPASRWFKYYASVFNTVELNSTFYRLPTEKALGSWHDNAPPGFVFAAKASRLITHFRRLQDCEEALATYLEHIVLLGEHLGPILYQLPPNFQREDGILRDFLSLLPAAQRHVFEFRHASWWSDEVYDLLRRHNAGYLRHGSHTNARNRDDRLRLHALPWPRRARARQL